MSDEQLQLHDLQPAAGSTKKKIRVGRGEGGRRGKTAGRGTKGQKARNNVPAWFEGGRTPIHRQIPQLKGFKNPNKVVFNPVNVGDLAQFDTGTDITPDLLRGAGLSKKKGPIKVLGNGEIDKALTVKVHAASDSARSKIESAGGTVEIIES